MDATITPGPFGPLGRGPFFNLMRHAPAGIFGMVVRGDTPPQGLAPPGWSDTWGPISAALSSHDPLWGLEGVSPGFAQLMEWCRANSPAGGWEVDSEALDELAERVADLRLADEAAVALLDGLGIDPRDDKGLQEIFGLEEFFAVPEDDEAEDQPAAPSNVVPLHPEVTTPDASVIAETAAPEATKPTPSRQDAAMPDPFASLPSAAPAMVMERTELVRMLTAAAKVTPRTSTIPILENVMIQAAASGEVRMTTANMSLWLMAEGVGEVKTAGAITLPARALLDMVRSMPDGSQVELSPTDMRMAVRGGRARFSLPMLPTVDFPTTSVPQSATALELGADTLKVMFGRTRTAAGSQDARPYLQGVNLRTAQRDDGTILVAEASNQFLSITVEVPSPGGAVLAEPALIPTDTVSMALDLFTGGTVEIAISQTLVSFQAPGLRLVSKLVDSTFPRLEKIIAGVLASGPETGTATVEVRECLDTLRRVQIAISSERDAGIATKRIMLACGGGHVLVSTPPAGSDAASGEDAVTASIDGDFGTVSVNGTLMVRALESAPGETACITFLAGDTPLLVMKCPSPEHSGFTSYLTTMRG